MSTLSTDQRATIKLRSIKEGTIVEVNTATIAKMSVKVDEAAKNPSHEGTISIPNVSTDELNKFILWCRLHRDKNLQVWAANLSLNVSDHDIKGLGHLNAMKILHFAIVAHALNVRCLRLIMIAKWRDLVLNKSMEEVQEMLEQKLTRQNLLSLATILGWIPPAEQEVDDSEEESDIEFIDDNARLL